MNRSDIISSGLLEAYAMQSISAEDAALVEQWLKQSPEVVAELKNIEIALEQYAFANAVSVSSASKTTIFDAIEQDAVQDTPHHLHTKVSEPAKRVSMWKIAAAAAVLLLLGSAVLNVYFYKQNENLQASVAEKDEIMLAKNEEIDKLSQIMSVVKNKYSIPVSLNGLEAMPSAAAKIFWMKNTGEVYLDASNLPTAPSGMQYQLWAIVDGKPVDGGLFLTTDAGNKYGLLKMKSFGKAEAFAVTLETEGGNPQPQGDMYVMGTL